MDRKLAEAFISYACNAPHLITGTLNKVDILIMRNHCDYIVCDPHRISDRKMITYKNAKGDLIEAQTISEMTRL